MKIDRYLQNIKDGKPINFSSFSKKARAIGLTISDLQKLFKVNKYDKSRVLISIIDYVEFDKLCQKYCFLEKFDSRREAAKTFRSHLIKVSGTTFNVRNGLSHPYSVIVSKGGEIATNTAPQKSLLIIENEENFIDIKATYRFLKEQACLDIAAMDNMWGGGNRAANGYLSKYYSQYDKVYCFFDFELGVIKTAQSIFNLLTEPKEDKFEFIIADNAHLDLQKYGIDLNRNHIKALEKIRNECIALSKVINLMINTGKIMEQEVYL